MILQRRFKKSAIGATSVTLIPSTAGASESRPSHVTTTQIVVTTGSVTPSADFWGTAAADGAEYLVTFQRMT